MSSHHVVRDNQEPALVLVSSKSIDRRILHDYLEWSPYIIAFEEAYDIVNELRVKVDVLIGDKASVLDRYHTTIVKPTSNPIWQAFKLLKEKGHTHVHFFAEADKDLFDILALEKEINISVYSGNVKWVLAREGLYKKWVPKTQKFYAHKKVLPTFVTKNDLWEMETLREGWVTIKLDHPFWLGEQIAR